MTPRRPLVMAEALLCAFLAACFRPADRPLHRFEGETMGTTYAVQVAGRPLAPGERERLAELIGSTLAAVDARMSTFRKDSELSRLNQHASTEPFHVSVELLDVLLAAREVGRATGGAFDVTIASAVDAWGFGPSGERREPSEAELRRLRARTGWDKISMDEAASTVRKLHPGVRLDLSGIAKGYAVDRLALRLRKAGWRDFLIEVGGEVYASGRAPSGRPWRVGIERPAYGSSRAPAGPPSRPIERVVPLQDAALATSGDYRNYFERYGLRYSHIIDPRTLRPIRHRLASVSVLDPSCARADAFATALFVLGEQEGYATALALRLPAFFLVRTPSGGFREQATPGFENTASTEPPPAARRPDAAAGDQRATETRGPPSAAKRPGATSQHRRAVGWLSPGFRRLRVAVLPADPRPKNSKTNPSVPSVSFVVPGPLCSLWFRIPLGHAPALRRAAWPSPGPLSIPISW